MFGLVQTVTVLDDGDCGEIRSNSRYVVPENSDQGASNNFGGRQERVMEGSS